MVFAGGVRHRVLLTALMTPVEPETLGVHVTLAVVTLVVRVTLAVVTLVVRVTSVVHVSLALPDSDRYAGRLVPAGPSSSGLPEPEVTGKFTFLLQSVLS